MMPRSLLVKNPGGGDSESMTVSVLIADDHSLVRDALRLYLGSTQDIVCVGEASDGVQAVELVRKLAPTVVLMDVQMPRQDGVEATREITERWPETAVLALTTFSAEHRVVDVLRAGASGYLIKDTRKSRILEAIRQAADGSIPLSPCIAEELALSARNDRSAVEEALSRREQSPALPPREREALGLVSQGMSNREIAERMVVTERTVKAHLASLCRRLYVRDRVQLVIRAYELGIVEPRLDGFGEGPLT